MSPTWVAEQYTDPIVKEVVHELSQLVNAYSHRLYREEGTTALMVKDRRTPKNNKLVEYWPKQNRFVNTRDNHASIGVKPELSQRYHMEIARSGNPVKDPTVFIAILREIVEDLEART
ncbi:MAG: hypothetical protein ABIN58_01605 [candidate division WOR-3 bacterium]